MPNLEKSEAKDLLSSDAADAVGAFFERPNDFDLSIDYLKLFKLESAEPITKLDDMLIQRWSISSGYMTFLVLDLLNDIRPKVEIRLC